MATAAASTAPAGPKVYENTEPAHFYYPFTHGEVVESPMKYYHLNKPLWPCNVVRYPRSAVGCAGPAASATCVAPRAILFWARSWYRRPAYDRERDNGANESAGTAWCMRSDRKRMANMRCLSLVVGVMVVLMASAAAEEEKRQPTKGVSGRWKMPARLGPSNCNPGQSYSPPDADRWMQYECWRLRNLWLIVYAAYGSYEQGKRNCTPRNAPDKEWAQMTLFPGFLFSGLEPSRWYCLHHGGLEDSEEDARGRLKHYKGSVGRDGKEKVELKKNEVFVRHVNHLPLMDRDGRPIKTDGLDFRMMNDKVLLTFRYDRRPGYVPNGKEKQCPLPFNGTVASFGRSRRQIASATFSTDGISSVNFGTFSDGKYLLALQDNHSEACRNADPSLRTHFFVWSQEGTLLDWRTFKGAANEWKDYSHPPNPLSMCVVGAIPPDGSCSLEDEYGVKWDGRKLKRVEGDYCHLCDAE